MLYSQDSWSRVGSQSSPGHQTTCSSATPCRVVLSGTQRGHLICPWALVSCPLLGEAGSSHFTSTSPQTLRPGYTGSRSPWIIRNWSRMATPLELFLGGQGTKSPFWRNTAWSVGGALAGGCGYRTRGGTQQPCTKGRAEMLNAFPRPHLLLHHKPMTKLLTVFRLRGIQVCQMDSGFSPG